MRTARDTDITPGPVDLCSPWGIWIGKHRAILRVIHSKTVTVGCVHMTAAL